tara:strand:- start:341 stop:541 length:201 start_codon:yes stop_codon:yes gene_type:complete
MKYDIVFATDQAYTAAKTILTPHFACRFNNLDDRRIEFYLENRRDTAVKMLFDVKAVAEGDMKLVS